MIEENEIVSREIIESDDFFVIIASDKIVKVIKCEN